jgi:ABC-type sugar transport system ATPase subunit
MLSRLAEGGMAIAYISHRIPEVFEISSNVTILRDGRQVLTAPIADLTPQEVIDNMVGRELKEDLQTHRDATPGEVVLRATDIEAPRVNSVSLEVRAGEIVGLGGLVGAGRSELVRAIIGADNRTAGRVTLTRNGRSVTLSSYTSAVRNGVGYVPEERRTDGLALIMTVSDNIRLPNRQQLSRFGIKAPRKIAEFAQELADKVGLRPPEIEREAGQYSGGNQQKVVLAKWLGRRPDFMVLDEPTRGVDVGAKAEIHRLVKEMADNGTAVLVVSSDLPELLELSDVIHVMRDGRITGSLTREDATEQSVMTLAAGEAEAVA